MHGSEPDYACVNEELLLREDVEHGEELAWLAELRRSINGLHHSLAALHRKANHMSKVGDDLTAAVAALEQEEGVLETAVAGVATAVSDAGAAFTALDQHIEQLVNSGVLTDEQAEALQSRAEAVGTKLTAATTGLQTAAADLTSSAAAAETAGGAGAPADTGAGAGTGTGEQPGAGGTPTSTEKPLYNFTGDPANIDATQWTKADVQGEGGVALYTFNGDTAGGQATGPVVEGGGEGWTVWTGATEAVPAA